MTQINLYNLIDLMYEKIYYLLYYYLMKDINHIVESLSLIHI